MNKKVIIAIDPGSPKDRDKSATTGVFVGEYLTPKVVETASFTIQASNRENEENSTALKIKALVNKYIDEGYEVDVVMEQYINYAYNGAANNYQRNHTSELIGKIKLALSENTTYKLTEQSTSQIKTKYGDKALSKSGILVRKPGGWYFSEEFSGDVDGVASNRHERDACRHYLLRRDKLGMFNDIGEDVWGW